MTQLERMHAAEVRQPVLQGHQLLDGLWFPADWFDEPQVAPRILAAWQPGSLAFRFESGWLLQFPAALDLACDQVAGWPLRREGHALSSAPLTAAERQALPAADLWIVAGGRVAALRLGQARPVDPSVWLDVDSYALHDSYDCRAAVAAAFALTVAEPRDLRAVLGDAVPPASAAQLDFLRELALAQDRLGRSGAVGTARPARPSQQEPAILPRLRRIARWAAFIVLAAALGLVLLQQSLSQVAEALLRLLAAAAALFVILSGTSLRRQATWWAVPWGAPQQPAVGGKGQAVAAKPGRTLQPRGLAGRIGPQRWREWLARLAITSQVSQLLGRRQAAYLRRMLAMFDTGDLDQALRHAIPLGTDGLSLGQAFGTPRARQDLALSRQLGGRTSIHLGADLDGHLRTLYRQCFDKLDRAGRIDEAVFVLAELLGVRKEALDYLEKHERYAQAAEMALAWDMPSDLIVRLHCQAGDWRMAAAVARRDNAFANAIAQLAPKWPDAANRLRRDWGAALAARGEWLQAVDAVWPIEAAREQAAEWLRGAEAAGGALGARGLVRRAALLPDTMSAHMDRIAGLRDDPEAAPERNAVAEALLAQKEQSAATERLAGLLLGPILADHARDLGKLDRKELQRLIAKSGDRLLTADLPGGTLPGAVRVALAQHLAPLRLDAPEAGAQAVLDAVPLDAGRYLVALGEAGALMVDRFGRQLGRFAVPAQRLVIAESRQVALALARRDTFWRISRLDLANRKVTDLGMLECSHFADTFDGIGWSVALEDRFCVLDTEHSVKDVMWQVSDLGGRIVGLSHHPALDQFLLAEGDKQMSLWKYQLPQHRLLSRDRLPAFCPEAQFGTLCNNGNFLEAWVGGSADGTVALHLRVAERTRQVPLPADLAGAQPFFGAFGSVWTTIGLADPAGGYRWLLINWTRICGEIAWPKAPGMRLRMIGPDCIGFDEQGRVLHLDTNTSRAVGFALR